MTGRSRYHAILATPHVASLVASSILARLPMGIAGLAIVLYVSEARDSYAAAGLVSGAFVGGSAIGAPVQSRVIDRLGQRAVLVPCAAAYAAAIAALLAATELGAPALVLALCGLAGGLTTPNVSSALRTLWPIVLRRREELLPTAFALDSVAVEMVFTLGPLVTALAVVVLSPLAALVAATVVCAVGTVLFCAQPPSQAWAPEPDAGPRSLLGALRSGGVRTLMITVVPIGFCFGAVEIALPAFAKDHGAPGWAGVFLAIWALASAGGGLLYGARTWGSSLQRLFLVLAVLLPLGILPALLAPSVGLMALLIIPAGLLIAPLLATSNQLVGLVAPSGAVTEAYAWLTTALVAGFAPGAALGGVLIEASDWRAALVASAAAAAIGGTVAIVRRGTLDAALAPA